MCGENLITIICLEIFSASLWNLCSTGTFQKSISYKWSWPRRGEALEQEGASFLWCVAQIAALSLGQGRTPLSAAPAWNGSFGSLCSTSFLLFNTKRMDRRGPGSLCLSDPLNFIMKPWWHKFIYLCLSSALVQRDFSFFPLKKAWEEQRVGFSWPNAAGEIPTYITNVDVPFAFSCPTCPAGELCIHREQKLLGLWD